jgi:hypothetical protein
MHERRGPFTDPREGRLLKQIRAAFIAKHVEVLSSSVLLEWGYGPPVIRKLAGSPKWHRENIKRSALKICTPIGFARSINHSTKREPLSSDAGLSLTLGQKALAWGSRYPVRERISSSSYPLGALLSWGYTRRTS